MDASKMVENQVLQATQMIEQQVDGEIDRLEHMDVDDFEVLKQRRMKALQQAQKQKQEWLTQGHGQYEEISDEREFFETSKKSKNFICHFYRDSTFRCKIVDKHLALLAQKHVETKFVKINAEKCKFLIERLRIVVLPTISLAREGKIVDYVVGFDDIGGKDEFPTAMLEWRLAQANVLNYSGDLTTPPVPQAQKKSVLANTHKKTIRGKDDDSSDDDY